MGFWHYYQVTQGILAIFALAMALFMLLTLIVNYRYIRRLLDVPIPAIDPWPKISLIAPARNEERNIEAAMRSLLKIDYPNLQITVINDRSTDRTGEILRRLADQEPRLNVVDVAEHLLVTTQQLVVEQPQAERQRGAGLDRLPWFGVSGHWPAPDRTISGMAATEATTTTTR